jgi:hypothetical protein
VDYSHPGIRSRIVFAQRLAHGVPEMAIIGMPKPVLGRLLTASAPAEIKESQRRTTE